MAFKIALFCLIACVAWTTGQINVTPQPSYTIPTVVGATTCNQVSQNCTQYFYDTFSGGPTGPAGYQYPGCVINPTDPGTLTLTNNADPYALCANACASTWNCVAFDVFCGENCQCAQRTCNNAPTDSTNPTGPSCYHYQCNK